MAAWPFRVQKGEIGFAVATNGGKSKVRKHLEAFGIRVGFWSRSLRCRFHRPSGKSSRLDRSRTKTDWSLDIG